MDLAGLIADATDLRDGDIVVVAQKVVSKAEGAIVRLDPGEDRAAARRRLVREQAARIVADAPWALIVETRQGLVCANAGIDASNVEPGALSLLPEDPDASASRLRAALRRRAGVDVAVVISDTFGRPWRMGQTDVAIGLAGLPALRDERGGRDRYGMLLEVTEVALGDEVAAAADLIRRKADGVPVVVLRGLAWTPDESARAADLQRPPAEDLFPRGRGALADLLADPPELLSAAAPDGQAGPGADERRRALAAARRAGDGRVRVEPQGAEGEPLTVVLAADSQASDLIGLGAAAATLTAALADFGWISAIDEQATAEGHRLVVRVGRPEPRPVAAPRAGSISDGHR
ncbi:MAG: coenzyme F420-0:L-glutamate ligase [Nitriliruptorales bacterium]|nr:coenzyme F420-0:L-glutamate ligase [Nitriliruptorales bacterium]